MHLNRFWRSQIRKAILDKHKVDLSGNTITRAIGWMRRNMPKWSEKENVLDAICWCDRHIQDLTARRAQLLGYDERDDKTKREGVTLKGEGEIRIPAEKTTTETTIKTRVHWNAYVGVMREIRETQELRMRLVGILVAKLELGEDTMKGLHDILEGRWRPKLPEDIPEGARRAIEGEEGEE